MLWREFSETLLVCIDGATATASKNIHVTALDLEMPLEIASKERAGRLVFLAIPPHTQWVSGFLPVVHRAKMRVVLDESGGDD